MDKKVNCPTIVKPTTGHRSYSQMRSIMYHRNMIILHAFVSFMTIQCITSDRILGKYEYVVVTVKFSCVHLASAIIDCMHWSPNDQNDRSRRNFNLGTCAARSCRSCAGARSRGALACLAARTLLPLLGPRSALSAEQPHIDIVKLATSNTEIVQTILSS